MPLNIQNNLKYSFSKVKENILALDIEILALKSVISKQNSLILELSSRLLDLASELENSKKTQNQPISTGNEGVNQSINHSINQSLINQSLNHSPQNTQFSCNSTVVKQEKSPSEDALLLDSDFQSQEQLDSANSEQESNEKSKEKQLDLGTMFSKNHENKLKQEIFAFKTNINKAFSTLSKQELRVFLSIYQLDDELKGVSYTELAAKLDLTEPCIRGYVSLLMKKGLPISRKKINNRRTILTIDSEFKSLDLKQKLVSLYYENDPKQTTLFDRI